MEIDNRKFGKCLKGNHLLKSALTIIQYICEWVGTEKNVVWVTGKS